MPRKIKGRNKRSLSTSATKSRILQKSNINTGYDIHLSDKNEMTHTNNRYKNSHTTVKTGEYAGVLPWVRCPRDRIWVLLGREAGGKSKGHWSDFGGGVELTDHSVVQAAFREMHEETAGVLAHSGNARDNILPSVSFHYGSFKGSVMLGMLGDGVTSKCHGNGCSKKSWTKLLQIPQKFAETRKTVCVGEYSPLCEKDKLLWVCLDDIRSVEQSALFLKNKTIIQLRGNYGHVLSMAFKLIRAIAC